MIRMIRGMVRRGRKQTLRRIPSSEKLPSLWPASSNPVEARPDLGVLQGASTQALEELCDDYWRSFDSESDGEADEAAVVRDSIVRSEALKELATRRGQSLAWACKRLRHPEHFARRDAAWLVGELCSRNPQDCDLDAVIGELSRLATRPIEEDTKEAEANAVALASLSRIGGPRIIPTLREILTSPRWEQDDLSWEAARILGVLLNVPFGESEDPVASAREWVALNSDG